MKGWSTSVRTQNEWLDLALESKDIEKKLEYCSKHLESNANDEDAWLYKFYFLYQLGKEEELGICAHEIVKRRDIFLGEERLATLCRLGESSIGSDDESAIRYFDDLLREKPDYVWAWIYKGGALFNLKRYTEAVACFDNALKLNPSKLCKALVFGRKAAALELLGKIEEAIECCDSGLDIDPGNFVTLGLKGECLYMNGQFEKAIACFNEVLRINPNDEMAKKSKEIVERELKEELDKQAQPKKKGLLGKLFG
jgi:tetratricopeptide (TPR) repeat protein